MWSRRRAQLVVFIGRRSVRFDVDCRLLIALRAVLIHWLVGSYGESCIVILAASLLFNLCPQIGSVYYVVATRIKTGRSCIPATANHCLLLPPSQIISRFDSGRYINFAINL